MSNKITTLSELTSVSSDDIIYIVDDPSWSPLSKKITIANLFKNIVSSWSISVWDISVNDGKVHIEAVWTNKILTLGNDTATAIASFSWSADGLTIDFNALNSRNITFSTNQLERMKINTAWDVTINKDLIVATNVLIVDSTNGLVWIGKVPTFPLDVAWNSQFWGTMFANMMTINSINVTTLDVDNNIDIWWPAETTSKSITIETGATGVGSLSMIDWWNNTVLIRSDAGNSYIKVGTLSVGKDTNTEKILAFGTDVSIVSEGDGVTRAWFKIKTNNILRWDINSPSGSTDLRFNNGSIDILTIQADGGIGQGISNPFAKYHIFTSGTEDADVFLSASGTGKAQIGFDASNGDFSWSDYMTLSQDNNLDWVLEMFSNAGNFHIKTGNINRLTVTQAGNVGFLTPSPTAVVDINSDILRLRTPKTPASASDTWNQWDIAWDTSFIYVAIATNTWKRATLLTF